MSRDDAGRLAEIQRYASQAKAALQAQREAGADEWLADPPEPRQNPAFVVTDALDVIRHDLTGRDRSQVERVLRIRRNASYTAAEMEAVADVQEQRRADALRTLAAKNLRRRLMRGLLQIPDLEGHTVMLAEALVEVVWRARAGLPPMMPACVAIPRGGRKRAPGGGDKRDEARAILAMDVQRIMKVRRLPDSYRPCGRASSSASRVLAVAWAAATNTRVCKKMDAQKLVAPGRRWESVRKACPTRCAMAIRPSPGQRAGSSDAS